MSKSEVSQEEVTQSVADQLAQESETHTTTVKVKHTLIKFFSEELNTVEEVSVTGKLSVPECQKFVKEMNSKNVYILKEMATETFDVNTVALMQLKGGK
jgi:hypothetical protein